MLISRYLGDSICEKIDELEKKYNIVLSHDYKVFLMKYNGGETPKTSLSKKNVKTDIRKFYGFTEENQYSDLRFVLSDGLGGELISQYRIPIATNSYGDYFVMNVSEDGNGRIGFIYHDKPQTEIMIALDFKDFIDACKSEKIGHIRSIEERKQCLIDAGKGDKITQIKIECWQKEIDKYAGMQQEKVII